MVNLIREFKDFKREQAICLGFSFISILLILLLPYALKKIVDIGIAKKNQEVLITWILVYILVVFFQNLFEYVANRSRVILKKKYLLEKRAEILDKIRNIDGDFLSQYTTGKIINIIYDDIEKIGASFTTVFFDFFKNVLIGILAAICLINMSVALFSIVMALQLLIVYINQRLSNKMQKMTKEFAKQKDVNKQVLYEFINNIETIASSNECSFYTKRSINTEIGVQKKFMEIMNLSFINTFSGKMITSISQISIWFIGGILVIKSFMTFGEIIAFMSYSSMLLGPILCLTNMNYEIRSTLVSMERIQELKKNLEGEYSSKEKVLEINTIDYKDVSFSYPNSNMILDNVNLRFERGKIYGIIGKSGIGKTTLFKLLLGIWNVQAGEIRVNNLSIVNLDKSTIRDRISLVTQEVTIPTVSIRSYVTLGRDIEEKKIYRVLGEVNLLDKIIQTENGIDSIIDEEFSMSVGEKQKLCLAKALLKDKDILILDEFTSNLDIINEEEITKKILKYLGNKIVILITHRLSVLKYCDVVYENKDGCYSIVDKSKGLYYIEQENNRQIM